MVIASVGGGSNAMGIFHPFLDEPSVRLIGVEAAGRGLDTNEHAASIERGRPGVLHGNRTYLLQDGDGQIQEAHSISAGLDYPGIGPEHSWLHDIGRAEYVGITDDEALEAFQLCTRAEGIIPALECAHALAHIAKLAPTLAKDQIILMNLSGRGIRTSLPWLSIWGEAVKAQARTGWGVPPPPDPPSLLRCGSFREPLSTGGLGGPARLTQRFPYEPHKAARFAALRAEGRGALIPFLEAFDPDRDTSAAILRGMPAAGADLIEIGMPFTDPMADGPTIQAAGLRGLAAGATLAGTLDLVREFRAHDNATPIILMGYLNPLLAFGIAHFCARAADAGVDGLIVVDLPSEEADLLAPDAVRARPGHHPPGGPHHQRRTHAPGAARQLRLRLLRQHRRHHRHPHRLGRRIGRPLFPRIRRATDLPIAVGFGVRSPAQAAEAVRLADAADRRVRADR